MAPSPPPAFATDLVSSFGGPSSAGFGSAVFWEPMPAGTDLDDVAAAIYRRFVGPLWERFGEAAWTGPWRKVFERPEGAHGEVVAELGAIADAEARRSVPLLLEAGEDPERTHPALSTAFDGASVDRLAVYNVGDGAAMSGLLVAARVPAEAHALVLVALMD